MKVSKTGYKKNSKDKNQPSLLIPSNNITMKGVEFPVLGTDDYGNQQVMYPGMDYTFPGNYVHEVPMDHGGIVPGRYKNPEGNWVSKYTSGGDISIPDLSRPGWLSKYQKGQQVHQKVYTDPEEFAIANEAYKDSLDTYNFTVKGLKQILEEKKTDLGTLIDTSTPYRELTNEQAIDEDYKKWKSLGLNISRQIGRAHV